jgi:hypothetical protein
VVLTVAAVMAAIVPFVLVCLPERPADIGLVPYGANGDAATAKERTRDRWRPRSAAWRAPCANRDFWLLFATFFICGFTTNGLVGTHLIALCGDNGIPEVRAASLLAVMGIFDLVGTTGSGWLTDRYDPRKLLFMYYALAASRWSTCHFRISRSTGSGLRRFYGSTGSRPCRLPAAHHRGLR